MDENAEDYLIIASSVVTLLGHQYQFQIMLSLNCILQNGQHAIRDDLKGKTRLTLDVAVLALNKQVQIGVRLLCVL